MTNSEFENHVSKRHNSEDVGYAVIALNEEAGEVAGWYKKMVLRGNPTGNRTIDELKEELGDVLYYVTRLANMNGWTLSEIMETNKEKLDSRDKLDLQRGIKVIA